MTGLFLSNRGVVLQIRDRVEYLQGMSTRSHRDPSLTKNPVWIDQKSVSQRVWRHPGPVGLADRSIRVRQQGEAETFALAERRMVVDAVGTDAHHFGTCCQEITVQRLKPPGFNRAAACEIPWIEIHGKPSAAQIIAGPAISIGFTTAGTRQIEAWCFSALFQNNPTEGPGLRWGDRQCCQQQARLDDQIPPAHTLKIRVWQG